MTTKRGVNLGCGTITFPRDDKPMQHYPIPDEVYHDKNTQWDNVDRHAAPNVSHLINLFAYPWGLPSDTYDVAVASHIAEHIPHEIVWNGKPWGKLTLDKAPQSVRDSISFFGGVLIPEGTHPEYQGGWYAWFSELWRILKPSGKAYVLVPHAFSNAGVSEPTHKRYCLPATFNYFNPSGDFVTPGRQRWGIDFERVQFQPHDLGVSMAKAEMFQHGDGGSLLQAHSYRYINVMFGFMVTMTAVKDEPKS